MRSAKRLKEMIQNQTPTTGVILSHHLWLGAVEIAVASGLDYLIVDTEHQQFDDELVGDVCAVGRMLDFPVLIRPPATDATAVRLALDKGPCGLLLPMVEDVATLEAAQRGLLMPPRGARRPGGRGNRWVPNYHYATWKAEVEDDLIVLPQVENLRGLENVEAIAAHPLTTAMAVGPYDLSAHLGVCWEPESPTLLEAIDRVREAATRAGKKMWMIGDGPRLRKRGFHFVCLAEPMMLLESALKDLVQQTKHDRMVRDL